MFSSLNVAVHTAYMMNILAKTPYFIPPYCALCLSQCNCNLVVIYTRVSQFLHIFKWRDIEKEKSQINFQKNVS